MRVLRLLSPVGFSVLPKNNRLALSAIGLNRWAAQSEDSLLFVDGNNVRGAVQFQWSMPNLLERIEREFSRQSNLNLIVVLDHGSRRHAQILDKNVAIVFAGLYQRADDVIAKEILRWQQVGGPSLAVVTNDVGLSLRVRKARSDKDVQDERNPIVLDATSFASILNRTSPETNVTFPHMNMEVVKQVTRNANDQFSRYIQLQRQPYRPRRENTWQRVVLAETLRCALMDSDRPVEKTDSSSASLLHSYILGLQSRGYQARMEGGPPKFQGPFRLDKRQGRQLKRFAKALEHGCLNEHHSSREASFPPTSCDACF